MVDTVSSRRRSEMMSRVRAKDTEPELLVRRLVYGMGFRYRLHDRRLPGSPDLVFRKEQKVIFVHGCFWHQHAGCPVARMPKSRLDYWLPKLRGNRQRDQKNVRRLKRAGWLVLTIRECALDDRERVKMVLRRFLGKRRRSSSAIAKHRPRKRP